MFLGALLLGGDLTRGRDITVSATVFGDLQGRPPVTRSGARPGDVVAVCGRLGWAAAGLTVLNRGFRSPRAVVVAHRVPEPPYGQGIVAQQAGASAMIDCSDGLLADLGVSSHHFDDSERGFSFRFDGALDMRMNKRAGLTAADIVNTYDEERLADIFYLYGELKNSRKLASVIVKARAAQKIGTIGEFLEIIKPLFGREREKKELAKVFQALRIEVNREMEALKEMLLAATEALKPGGRLVVITYHSLEDRMVKNIMKTGNVEGRAEQDFFGRINAPLRPVNNKVIVPDEAEIERNPRSRSAKLRIAEKV